MARIDKIIAKMRASQSDVDFSDLAYVLEWLGFSLSRAKGSHHTFKRPGHAEIVTLPRHNPMKTEYVRMVLRLFEQLTKDES